MAQETGRLAENIVHFARALRAAGIPVGPGSVLDALAAVEAAGVSTRDDFYWTLHAVFVKRHEHTLLFDQAFRIFFRRRAALDKLLAAMLPQAPPRDDEKPPPGAQRVQEALLSNLGEGERKPPELEVDARLTVSDREVLQRKDFATGKLQFEVRVFPDRGGNCAIGGVFGSANDLESVATIDKSH